VTRTPSKEDGFNRSIASIKAAASNIAYNLMTYYTGNVTNTPDTIAILPAPYYWWEAGAMWGALVDYYHYTGDASYNEVTSQALNSQVGPLSDFIMPNQEFDEGNDDQSFWGFAAMSAAEKNYPAPEGSYSWVQLVENLWNTQVYRWDTTSCGGGLKWQIYPANKGWDYKNSISNGAFFQLSARLARFTGNQTYLDWALKSYEWSTEIGLIGPNYEVFDGTDDSTNCTGHSDVIWSYNTAVYLYGAAVLYNYTDGSDIWTERTNGFLNAASQYFHAFSNSTNMMVETACEPANTCDTDQYSFKGYLSRFMWASTLMAPFTTDLITTYLQGSSVAAARACSGGADGNTCGQHWYWETAYDGYFGAGQQMSALETIQGLLVANSPPPMTSEEIQRPKIVYAC
jgi:mannan endo-1,6-alpha-mannosidase